MICCFSAICVLLMVTDNTQPWMLYYYSIALGLGFGISAPLVAATVTDIFQGPRVGGHCGLHLVQLRHGRHRGSLAGRLAV